jgi:hypothetical protein
VSKGGLLALLAAAGLGLVLALGARVALTAPDTALPWSAFGGGGNSSSAGYRLGATVGQPAIGGSESASFSLGAGLGYGACGPAADLDCDHGANSTESACGSDPADAASSPERLDLAGDDDGDAMLNEALPSPGSDGFDCDGDGWTGAQEMALYAAGTTANDQDACGGNGWPADMDPNNILDIGDFNSFTFPLGADDGHGTYAYFGHPAPDAGRVNEERWNLAGGGMIDIGDLNAISPAVTASTSRPPMFGGTPAFGQTCPWPP